MDSILDSSGIKFDTFDLGNPLEIIDLKDDFELWICKNKSQSSVKIYTLRDKSNSKIIISCIVLEEIKLEIGECYLLHRTFTNPNFRSRGFAKRIYYQLIYRNKFHIVSDVKLVPSTWKIWEELIKNFSSYVKIISTKDYQIQFFDYNGENLHEFNSKDYRFCLMTNSNLSLVVNESIVADNYNFKGD